MGPEPSSCGRGVAYELEKGFIGLTVQYAPPSHLSDQCPSYFAIDFNAADVDVFLELIVLTFGEEFNQFLFKPTWAG
jgi:hypothetical protein